MDFRLPALGEGIESATVTAVLVKPGDDVKAGQNVVSVETDKAAVDVPADAAGTVAQVHIKPGDKLPAGGLILTLNEAGKPGGSKSQPPASSEKPAPKPPPPSTPAPSAKPIARTGRSMS